MPAIGAALGQLIQTNVDSKMSAVGGNPLGQKDPSYFIAMCAAIGTGIASQATLTFTTTDAGAVATPPIPGIGAGVGVIVDEVFMSEKMYTYLRDQAIADFGSTAHSSWPPSGGSGLFLKALTDGICESIKTHFATAWILASVHPTVYLGTGLITAGGFSGVVEAGIASVMAGAASQMKGPFWPKMCTNIAKGFKDGIEQKATGTVVITGICIPLVPPAGFQICGVPGTGSGSGVAS